MKRPTAPKLPLTFEEKARLRQEKIALRNIHMYEAAELASILVCTEERALFLTASASFQQIPSIGVKFTEMIIEYLGMMSVADLRNKEGAAVLNELELKMGVWTDPCVEDQIRCVIYHANHPGSEKQWFDFTAERKVYREKEGYPATRPQKAWYERQTGAK